MSSEKVSFNMSVVDLGKIQMLVERGVYTNRTDFITKAIVHELSRNEEVIDQVKKDHNWGIGILYITKEDLLKCVQENKKMDLFCIGMLVLDKKIDLPLAQTAIGNITVYGKFTANEDVKKYYA